MSIFCIIYYLLLLKRHICSHKTKCSALIIANFFLLSAAAAIWIVKVKNNKQIKILGMDLFIFNFILAVILLLLFQSGKGHECVALYKARFLMNTNNHLFE